MVKFKSIAKFPVGHLAHSVVSTLSVLICLLCDWSFRLYPHLTYVCCYAASYQFLLWYDWFWWCFFFFVLIFFAIRTDSVSLFKFRFLSHVNVILLLRSFSNRMVFRRSLSDCKFLQVSRTFLSILVYQIIDCTSLISKSSCPFTTLFRLLRVYLLQLVSPSPSCFIA